MKKHLILLITCVLFLSQVISATSPKSWTFSGYVINAFWKDGNIGIVTKDKFIAISQEQKNLFSYPLDRGDKVTEGLKILSSDGHIYILENGKKQELFNGQVSNILENNSGMYLLLFRNNINQEIRIFSQTNKELWNKIIDNNSTPIYLTRDGKNVFSIKLNQDKIILSYIDDKSSINCAIIHDPKYKSGDYIPIIKGNALSDSVLLSFPSASWFSIYKNDGTLLSNRLDEKIRFFNLFASYSTGFLCAKQFDTKLYYINSSGKIIWVKDLKMPIQSIDGNEHYGCVSLGNIGFKGSVLLINDKGQLNNWKVDNSFQIVKIDENKPSIIGFIVPTKVSYFNFSL